MLTEYALLLHWGVTLVVGGQSNNKISVSLFIQSAYQKGFVLLSSLANGLVQEVSQSRQREWMNEIREVWWVLSMFGQWFGVINCALRVGLVHFTFKMAYLNGPSLTINFLSINQAPTLTNALKCVIALFFVWSVQGQQQVRWDLFVYSLVDSFSQEFEVVGSQGIVGHPEVGFPVRCCINKESVRLVSSSTRASHQTTIILQFGYFGIWIR